MLDVPGTDWRRDPEHDTNDGKRWSQMDVDDLELVLKNGGTIEAAAAYLCRAGSVEEVRAKAFELGLITPR